MMNKKHTYLQGFEDHSRFQYLFVSKAKWIGFVVLCLMCIGILTIGSLPIQIGAGIVAGIQLLMGNDITKNVWFEAIVYGGSTAMTIGMFVIYVRFIEKRPFKTIGLRKPFIKKYLLGVVLAMLMQMLNFVIVLALGYATILEKPEMATNGVGVNALLYVGVFLVVFLIQGASEEVAIRGWLLPVLSRHYSIPVSIIISSLLFGFLHIFNPNIEILPIVNLVLYGVFAALYAIYDEGLIGIFAFHSIWNWFMGNVLGFPVSGMILGSASIIETKVTGPSIITGGEFGPEGGIVVTVLLSLGCILLYLAIKKKNITDEIDIIGSKDYEVERV